MSNEPSSAPLPAPSDVTVARVNALVRDVMELFDVKNLSLDLALSVLATALGRAALLTQHPVAVVDALAGAIKTDVEQALVRRAEETAPGVEEAPPSAELPS